MHFPFFTVSRIYAKAISPFCYYSRPSEISRRSSPCLLYTSIGITEANLSILRSGKAKGVRFSTINKICYYLECDVGDILKFDGVLEEGEEDYEK